MKGKFVHVKILASNESWFTESFLQIRGIINDDTHVMVVLYLSVFIS